MGKRVEEIRHAAQPWKADKGWKAIRRGWYLGGELFRQEMVASVGSALKRGKRASFFGEEVKEHDAACAETWITKGMKRLKLDEADLVGMKMNCPQKYALAWLARRNSCVSLGWIRTRLKMGTATSFSGLLKKMENASKGEWGFAELAKVKDVK